MKDISNYEGLYAATRDGKIWSYPKPCSSTNGMFLKAQLSLTKHNRTTPHKQLLVGLRKEGKRKVFQVHRLIALTYIPNPENNNVDNLEWCTKKENMRHAIETGLWDLYSESQIRNRERNRLKILENRRQSCIN